MRRLLRRLAIGYQHHGKDDDTPYLIGGAFLVAVVFLGLVGASSPIMSRLTHTYTNVAAVITATLVDLANADRAANGAGVLVVNPVLAAAAQAKANDMAAKGYFAHFDATGKGPWDWMHEAGYVYHYAGENLAIEFSESADVERAWLNSPAHRQNLLDPRFTEVGIATADGIYQGRPTTFVVQFFGTPAPTIAIREAAAPAIEPAATSSATTTAVVSVQPTTTPDVVVLGLVSDTTEPAVVKRQHHVPLAADTASSTPTTTPSLLLTAQPAPPDLTPVPVLSQQNLADRLHASPSSAPRVLVAFLAALVAFALTGALLRELEHWHLKHAFYAASLSAASVAVALVAVTLPTDALLLDTHPIAFASDPSASVAVRAPAELPLYASYAAPRPVQQLETAAVGSLDWNTISPILASSPLIPLFALFAIVGAIVAAVVYIRRTPERHDARTEALAQQLVAVTQNLDQAERIGQFGSFFWDYQEPGASFWSAEMYVLTGLVRRKTPPPLSTFSELSAPEDKVAVTEAIHKAETQPGAFSFTMHLVAPDKSTRYLRIEGTTQIRESGHAWRIHGFAHDITREVEIDKSKSEFVSLASHQLKTPLTSIRWLIEAMQSGAAGEFTPQQKGFIEKIGQSTLNMITIVNDLLNVSRIEMNRLATQLEELDVRQVGESVIDEQRHAAEARRIALTYTCAPDVPRVQADRNALRMIFQNLISNAIKYTQQGGSVTCDIALAGARHQAIYLTVSDTGIGIPKDEQARVFEKMHRAKNAQATSVEGTGLGLYVVKTVIEKAGGAVTFDSTEGKGSTFTVTIPLAWKAAASQGIGTLA